MFEEAWAPHYTYIGMIIDADAIQKLQVRLEWISSCSPLIFFLSQLELTLDDVKWAIVSSKRLKIKQEVGNPRFADFRLRQISKIWRI